MRTRFLNVDYFNQASHETLENCSIFLAPVPDLPPINLSTEEESFSFHFLPISSEFRSLFFKNALSNFLSSVIPEIYSAGKGEFLAFSGISGARRREFRAISSPIAQKGDAYSDDEKDEGKRKCFTSRTPEMEIPLNENSYYGDGKDEERIRIIRFKTLETKIPQKEKSSRGNEKDDESCRIIQFEIPEVEIPLKECFVLEEDAENYKEIQLETSDSKLSPDILRFEVGEVILYPCECSNSDYSVEAMTVGYHSDRRSSYQVEDASSGLDISLLHSSKICDFEVGEVGLEKSMSMEEEFHAVVTNGEHSNWTQSHGMVVDSKEFLGSVSVDILDCLSGHSPPKRCLEVHHTCLDSLLEIDFRIQKDNMHPQSNTAVDLKELESDSFTAVHPVQFHEIQVLDLASVQSFEVFSSLLITNEPEISEQMFREDLNSFKSFYESIVGLELALVDDTFKSYPVPVLCDHIEVVLLPGIVEDILSNLKPHLASACDGIYLDWHLLQETCTSVICSAYREKLEVDTHMTSRLQSTEDGSFAIDLAFHDDTSYGSKELHCKETLGELPGAILVDTEPLMETTSSQLLKKDNTKMPQNGKPMVKMNSGKISLFLESLSLFNDLKFFMNARKGDTLTDCEGSIKEKDAYDATVVSFGDLTEKCVPPEVSFQKWNIEVHSVKLSDHILVLIDNIRKSYLAVLENDAELKKNLCTFPVVDDYESLSLPKQKLMNLIKELSARINTLMGKDETVMALITLYAMKKMAYYLCFYGIHTTSVYVSKLFRGLEFLGARLALLQSLIEDAQYKVEKEIIESHPALSIVEEILTSNFPQNGKKVLIMAERVFWWPLNRKLTTMKILFHELNATDTLSIQENTWGANGELTNSIFGALLHSDCLITSHEYIFPSFPFNKFAIILEYGGSCGSSRMLAISPKLDGLPHVHFLKVKLDDPSVSHALCEGFDASQQLELTMEGTSELIMHAMKKGFSSQQCLCLLNFVPILEKGTETASLEAADQIKDCPVLELNPNVPLPKKYGDINSSTSSFPDLVIIVNTQNLGQELLTSRRSSYQKILALEKGGVQVVERELSLPVDLIFSAAICLVWYDVRKIGNYAPAGEETSSCISICVENIATNLLMSLSFAFSDCVLVFEGETNFLAAIMESSDGLYAAAASLDLHLQLFFSGSPELTDEITLSCVRYAKQLNKGINSAMLESETLGESFLTSFPSINPLSAHAVLSCGGTLLEFLEWSHEHRIQALRKYRVPDESVDLFNSLCRFGELGESKSGMTECSSSLSSALDSDKCYSKTWPQDKKQKYSTSTHSLDLPMDDCMYLKPLNQYKEGRPKPSEAALSYQPGIFSNSCQEHKGIKGSNFSMKYNSQLGQKQGLDTLLIKDLGWEVNSSENVHGDFRGEVIDLDSSFFSENISSIENCSNFSREMLERGKEAAVGNSIGTSRFAVESSNAFPNSAESNCDSDIWVSLMDSNRWSEEEIYGQPDTDANMLMQESNLKKISSTSALGMSKRSTPHYSTGVLIPKLTGLSQQGSPWTIEFLNRIKEKAKLHQRSPPCNTSLNCSGSSRNMGKSCKRQSPSCIEGYRYQGSSQFTKATVKKKWLKRFRPQLDSSHRESKDSSCLVPTWTPADKRARQALSFARNGNEKQSKLVWGDGNSHGLRKRYRKEA